MCQSCFKSHFSNLPKMIIKSTKLISNDLVFEAVRKLSPRLWWCMHATQSSLPMTEM